MADVPLCVDLDGTLVATDCLHECIRELLRRRPWMVVYLAGRLPRGRAAFKCKAASLARLDASRLPYREDVMAYLRSRKAAGCRLILVTAANERIARAVAAHVRLFDEVVASDETTNVKGAAKAAAIAAHLGGAAFDYIGDSTADIAVFDAARQVLLAHPSKRLLRMVEGRCGVAHVFGPPAR